MADDGSRSGRLFLRGLLQRRRLLQPSTFMLPIVHISVLTFLVLGGRAPGSAQSRTPRCVRCSADEPIDVDAKEDDATFASCMKMKVGELKSELELRKIDISSMFEKDELARALADARAAGRADPSLLDDFNRQSAEAAFNSDGGPAVPDSVADAVASDGGLPGGMSPDKLQKLVQDPELMAMLRNPKMQEVMKKVMEGGPEAAVPEMMNDPEVKEMIQKISKITGGA